MQPLRRSVVIACLLLAGTVMGARADVQALVVETFAALDRGDAEADAERKQAAYATAVARAEEAVRENDASADAHYALFCSLGRLTELRGPIRQALTLPRLRRELDRTIKLNPMHSEALAAKGEMLLRLPRLLGGSAKDAEAYLHLSLLYDPTFWRAHLLLARALMAQSRPDAAREELVHVLAIITPERHERTEALQLLAELGQPSSAAGHEVGSSDG